MWPISGWTASRLRCRSKTPRSLSTDGGRYYSLYQPSLARLNGWTAAMGQFVILFGERFEVPARWGLKAKE